MFLWSVVNTHANVFTNLINIYRVSTSTRHSEGTEDTVENKTGGIYVHIVAGSEKEEGR